jgi:hypothetical protein
VRYDLQFLETIHADRNNVSPRLGFAWSPFESRDTVIRGNFGLFYDRVPLRALANALLSARNTTDLGNLSQISLSLSPTQAGAPVFPNILNAAVPTGALVNLATMNRTMQNAYSEQGSMEIEQRLGRNSTLSVSYQRLRGLRLIVSVNQNVPSCAAVGANQAGGDGDARPAAAAVVGRPVPGRLELEPGEGARVDLRLLHQQDVRSGALDPLLDGLRPGLQRVDVPGRDPHDEQGRAKRRDGRSHSPARLVPWATCPQGAKFDGHLRVRPVIGVDRSDPGIHRW